MPQPTNGCKILFCKVSWHLGALWRKSWVAKTNKGAVLAPRKLPWESAGGDEVITLKILTYFLISIFKINMHYASNVSFIPREAVTKSMACVTTNSVSEMRTCRVVLCFKDGSLHLTSLPAAPTLNAPDGPLSSSQDKSPVPPRWLEGDSLNQSPIYRNPQGELRCGLLPREHCHRPWSQSYSTRPRWKHFFWKGPDNKDWGSAGHSISIPNAEFCSWGTNT